MSIIELRKVERGHSLFDLINEYCLEEREGRSINRPFHRLCSLMREADAKTAVVESIDSSNTGIKDEYSALRTYCNENIKIESYRFTFVSENISSLKEITKLEDNKFLSSAVLINFQNKDVIKSYLFKVIVTKPRICDNNGIKVALPSYYLHIYKTFPCEINVSDNEIHRFNITGTFFCQQNSATSVCAHCSLCMVINNMDLKKNEMILPEDINKIIGIDHKNDKLKSNKGGLSIEAVQKVLEEIGLSTIHMNFFEHPDINYNEYIYNYIESRYPVLLIFRTINVEHVVRTINVEHVVSVLGHTLNWDMWRPEAELSYSYSIQGSQVSRLNYRSTSAWVDHFIIHDDNFGMYLCLPVDALKRVTIPKYDPSFRASSAVVILPPNVTTPAWKAEQASVIITKYLLQWLKNNNVGLDKWSDRVLISDKVSPQRPAVVRTFLIDKKAYSKSLDQTDFEGNKFSESDKAKLTEYLPSYFWLSEITLPDLYTANKTKIIDFFYKSDYSELLKDEEEMLERWIQIRFPFGLMRRNEAGKLDMSKMSVKSHYPLLQFADDKSPPSTKTAILSL